MNSNIATNLPIKCITYGHGNCIIILVAERMGLNPALVAEAARHLQGSAIHPMTGAAIEKEAGRLNDVVRGGGLESVQQANRLAAEVKVLYGFAERKLPELESVLRAAKAEQGGAGPFEEWVRAAAANTTEVGREEAVEYLRLKGDLRDKDLGEDGQWTLPETHTEANRDYQYKIFVADEWFMSGDVCSIGIIFANLTGRNFDRKEQPASAHIQWLVMMERETKSKLPVGNAIRMESPEGTELAADDIGAALPRTSKPVQ